jgi:hypothetical protein
MKDNALYQVTKVILDNSKKKVQNGVIKEQYVTVGYKDHNGEDQRLKLRRITFKGEDGKIYIFITNNFKLKLKSP